MNSCEDLHETSVNLRTVSGRISNSAALSLLRRQLVNVAFHPGGVNAVPVLLPLGEA